MTRPILKIHATSAFAKSFRNLPTHIQALAEDKDKRFRKNAFDLSLQTHKLKGALTGYWSYAVAPKYRILFRFLASDEAIYYDVGAHDIYRA